MVSNTLFGLYEHVLKKIYRAECCDTNAMLPTMYILYIYYYHVTEMVLCGDKYPQKCPWYMGSMVQHLPLRLPFQTQNT